MDTLLVVIAVVLVGLVFPIVAGVIALRRGNPGWCVATILTIPIALGWLIGILALTRPDRRGSLAAAPAPVQERIPTVRKVPNPPFRESKPGILLADKGGAILKTVIILGVVVLLILLAVLTIQNLKQDIATGETAMLVMRILTSAIFMTVLLLILQAQFVRRGGGGKRWMFLPAVSLVILFIGGAYAVLNRSVQRLPVYDETFWTTMERACSGWGKYSAAEYKPGAGPHPVVSINRNLYFLPFEWLPDPAQEIELVLCLGDEVRTTINTCQYTGNHSWARIELSRKATLVTVRDAQVIAEKTFRGGEPANCPYQISDSGFSTGTPVKSEDILEWMRPFIED